MKPSLKVVFLGNHTVGVRVLNVLASKLNVVGVVAHPAHPEDGNCYESVFKEADKLIGLKEDEEPPPLVEEVFHIGKNIYNIYKEELSSYVNFQNVLNEDIILSFWIIAILLDDEVITQKLMKKLQLAQIETRPLFFPVDKLPFYTQSNNLPISKNIYKRGVCLPSYPGLKKEDQLYVISIIKETIMENNG